MGAFFTNIQVQTQAVEAVRAAVVAWVGQQGLRPAAEGEAPDRRVLLASGAGYVSVYDEASEDQDEAGLRGLLLALSQVGPSFSTLVHDSDVWVGEVAVGGRRVDRYVSDPNYFGGRRKKRGDPAVHAAVWAGALGAEVSALKTAFGVEDLFAEAALERLGEVLGLPATRLATGYRYRAGEADPGEILSFCWVVRPAGRELATGGPRLVSEWTAFGVDDPEVSALEVSVGAAAQVSVTALSVGGPGTEVVVRILGDGPMNWERADVVIGDPSAKGSWHRAPLDGGEARVSAPFPAGPADPQRLTGLQDRIAAQVHVNVHGRARAEGEASWGVQITPAGGDGFVARRVVRGVRTDDRPLRAPPTVSPVALAPLRDRRRLVALVVLEPEAAAGVGAGVAALAPWFPAEGKVALATFFRPTGGPMKAPKSSRVAAAGFLGGKAWQKALTTPGVGQVDAAWDRTAGDPEGPARICLGSGILPRPDAVPALALGVPAADGAEEVFRAAIDQLATSGAVIQALLTRWGSIPGPDMTAYELACGVMGQCTLQRAWVERWLRGVGPGYLWLGQALRAHVRVDGETVGTTLRVRVSDVSATERALADVLPGAADWTAGVRAMYAGR